MRTGISFTVSPAGRRRLEGAIRDRNAAQIHVWRSLKYEAVYLHELTDGFKADRVIGEWIDFYNTERPHSVHDGQTPAEAYHGDRRPVDMLGKPDGLPTSPPAQQQQQDVINRVLVA
jgi:transposase InsO family protein